MNAGEVIRSIRKKYKLSQAKFADSIGFSQSYIKDIELGKTSPSDNIIEAINKRFNESLGWVLKGDRQDLAKKPKYPHIRERLLLTYKGKDFSFIESALSEGEFSLFERLIVLNTIIIALENANEDPHIKAFIDRRLKILHDYHGNSEQTLLLENNLQDIPTMKKLVVSAFSEVDPPPILSYFFTDIIVLLLESWDYDSTSSSLGIKLFNHEVIIVDFLVPERLKPLSLNGKDVHKIIRDSIYNAMKSLNISLNEEEIVRFHNLIREMPYEQIYQYGVHTIIKERLKCGFIEKS